MQAKSRIPNKNIAAWPTPKNLRKPMAVSIKKQKAVAKLGMQGSLGALFLSGFFKFQGAKTLHMYSGFGLLAFTVWHHLLNRPHKKRRRQQAT